MFGELMSMLGSFGKGAQGAQGGLQGLMGLGSTFGKITGIPMPWDTSAADMGKDARNYMQNAFPGTGVRDHLGAGGAGSVQAAGFKNQERLQRAELETRENIAELDAKTKITSAALAHGPRAVSAMDQWRTTGVPGDYPTMTSIAEKRLPGEIHKLWADSEKALSDANLSSNKAAVEAHRIPQEKARADYAKRMTRAEYIATIGRNPATTAMNAMDLGYRSGDKKRDGISNGVIPGTVSVGQGISDIFNSIPRVRPSRAPMPKKRTSVRGKNRREIDAELKKQEWEDRKWNEWITRPGNKEAWERERSHR